MQWFIDNHPDVPEHIEMTQRSARGVRRLLSLVESQTAQARPQPHAGRNGIFSPYGVRALSRFHKDHPYEVHVNGNTNRVDYDPLNPRQASLAEIPTGAGPSGFR